MDESARYSSCFYILKNSLLAQRIFVRSLGDEGREDERMNNLETGNAKGNCRLI